MAGTLKIAVVTLMALLLSSAALTAQSPLLEPDPLLPDGSNEFKAGDEFYLDIKVGADSVVQNLFGVSFILGYDTTKVSVLQTAKGNFLGNDVLFFPMHDPSEVAVGLSAKSGAGASGSGVLARIRIRIKDNLPAGTQALFRIDRIVANDPNGIPILLTAGQSTIVLEGASVLPGDVNANGKVNIFDLLALLRELQGRDTYPNSDVNNDGRVNIHDLIALLRILHDNHHHHGNGHDNNYNDNGNDDNGNNGNGNNGNGNDDDD